MPSESPRRGIRQFFSPVPFKGKEIVIHGIGVREVMPPTMVYRPHGTEDCLLMLFHHEAYISCRADRGSLQPAETLMAWTEGRPQHYGHDHREFTHSWIHCKGRRVQRMLRSSRLPLNRPIPVSTPQVFEQALLSLYHELITYSRPDPVIAGNLLENALREIMRGVRLDPHAVRVPENLLAVRKFLGTAPAEPVSLHALARLAGMSVPHFCARFKQHFGLAPMDCLIRHRLQHAAHLLGNRNLNIAEIGRLTGYEDGFHFSRMFKRRFGLSPKAYREQASRKRNDG